MLSSTALIMCLRPWPYRDWHYELLACMLYWNFNSCSKMMFASESLYCNSQFAIIYSFNIQFSDILILVSSSFQRQHYGVLSE